jgi:uncharacterized membrane protein
MESTGTSTTKPDPMRHHAHYLHVHGRRKREGSPYAGGSSFMERMAERVASGMGTVTFVVGGSTIIIAWILINGAVPYLRHMVDAIGKGGQFDPEPWILLNLIFSGVAFYTGALVIIAQKAQTRTDKANEEANAKHREEISGLQTDLLQQNTDLTQQIHEMALVLRTLTEQVHAATCPSS